jgi:hypothetical protein
MATKRKRKSSTKPKSHSALRDPIWATMSDRTCSFDMTYDEALESIARTPSLTGRVIVLNEVANRAVHGPAMAGEGNR